MEKRELRRHYLALRASLEPEERRRADAAICRNIRQLACYRETRCIAAYASDGREPDLFALREEKRFFLPRYLAAKGCQTYPAADAERGQSYDEAPKK